VELNTRVRALEYLIQQKGLAGVTETTPSFSALLVYYDPGATTYETLCTAITELAAQADTAVLPPSRTVELPCCYDDPELGFDLAAAAERLGLGVDELVQLHAGADYLVYFIGFTPGLPYLGGMPDKLRIPRLETPRTKVPAGSVGIGGVQCCIYSVDSPGGYWVLGRTPLRLYDPGARDPILLRPGDHVRFKRIDRREFNEIQESAAATSTSNRPPTIPAGLAAPATTIKILEPGAQTTVQDLGRPGQLRYGIPPSGPIDRASFILANRLVGNADTAAGLECTVLGPRFEVGAPCAIAVTGADMPVTINGAAAPAWATLVLHAGDVVKVGTARSGVRSYVAFSGGIDLPLVLASRSTYLRGRLGGLDGRALRKEDVVRVLPAPMPARRHVKPTAIPDLTAAPTIRVVLGPQAERFTEEGIAALLGGDYEMLPQSDRMGARLRGARIAHRRGHDIISDGIALGSIQVPGDGQPIALLVDRQSTGGYTKVATVCSFDIGRLGQVKPGQRLRFRAVTLAEAHRSLGAWPASLADALAAD